jgi:hypothetical protein
MFKHLVLLLKSVSTLSMLIKRQKRAPPSKRVNSKILSFLNHLIVSAVICLIFYYLLIVVVWLTFTFFHLNDPSLHYNEEYVNKICNTNMNSTINQNDMTILILIVKEALHHQNYFICYGSLYEALRLKEKYHRLNHLDLCLFDSELILDTFWDLTSFSYIQRSNEFKKILNDFKIKTNNQFKWSYKSSFGFYHFEYKQVISFYYRKTKKRYKLLKNSFIRRTFICIYSLRHLEIIMNLIQFVAMVTLTCNLAISLTK